MDDRRNGRVHQRVIEMIARLERISPTVQVRMRWDQVIALAATLRMLPRDGSVPEDLLQHARYLADQIVGTIEHHEPDFWRIIRDASQSSL